LFAVNFDDAIYLDRHNFPVTGNEISKIPIFIEYLFRTQDSLSLTIT